MELPSRLEFRPLHQDDVVRSLSLGSTEFTPLKTFLARESKRLQLEHLARTLVAVEPGGTRVFAYATLVCASVAVEKFAEGHRLDGYRYDDYPAVKLARLAVDRSLRRRGVGTSLLRILIGQATESIMPVCGCRFVVVEAKPGSVAFYLQQAFRELGEIEGKTLMYLDLLALPPALAGRADG